ncbi:MAG TPA: hypothetical protein VFX12_00180 [Vicinamibacterales bacterium]|nr:hypothetical protein [Vicinamibacterales bacterium]
MVHAARRHGGRTESRILYWFRTPPGVRVGRAALDEDAIKMLEERHPDIRFDWTRMLTQPALSPAEPAPGTPPNRRRDRRAPERPPRPRASQAVPAPRRQEPAAPAQEAAREPDAPVDAGRMDDEQTLDVPDEVAADRPPAPAEARLGPEGLSRLRGRYAEVLARISESAEEEATRARLKERAERLNPDAWVTDAEVHAGLEEYETVYAELRAVVGHGRRSRRRPPEQA